MSRSFKCPVLDRSTTDEGCERRLQARLCFCKKRRAKLEPNPELAMNDMIMLLSSEGYGPKDIGEKLNVEPEVIRGRLFRLRRKGIMT